MTDNTVEQAKQAVLHEALDFVDSRETFHAKVDALIAAVRAESVPHGGCTCGAWNRANAKYGHLNWCPLWVEPTPHPPDYWDKSG